MHDNAGNSKLTSRHNGGRAADFRGESITRTETMPEGPARTSSVVRTGPVQIERSKVLGRAVALVPRKAVHRISRSSATSIASRAVLAMIEAAEIAGTSRSP